ncbi:lyase family protein [Ruegeria faecimaris]|uniref:lyase family protein n=1 Tax=Ruegeria faecimaris TaxID=686389 RepID=UPI002492F2A2|nr:lyase family protein [Ruegeria faecimaris]
MLEFGLYRDCFSTRDMRVIWSEHSTISAWLKVEQTLARCQAEAGLIPNDAARAIEALSPQMLDKDQMQADMLIVGRPIVGLIQQMREALSDHAKYFHFRATTQDIMDTALAMQMKIGLAEIGLDLQRLLTLLDQQIVHHGGTMMMGRTNGQHAVPMCFATKLQVWKSELVRRQNAIDDAAQRGLNVQIGGPVGDLRAYDNDDGSQIKRAVAHALGLGVIDPHWQNARDGIADIVTALGALCATICKISHNVNLLSSTDIAEIAETHETGRGASSAMAHKQNQRASEFGEAVGRLGRQRAEQIGELTLHQHERSGGVWIGEWIVVPEVFLLTSGAVHWAGKLFAILEVDTDSMRRKLPEEAANTDTLVH